MARVGKYNVQNNKATRSTKKLKARLYLRISNEDGDIDDGCKRESESIYNQRLVIKDYLAKNLDIEIAEEYIDEGYSGTNFDRHQFLQIIEDIRLGKINCVIVKELSRFGSVYLELENISMCFFLLWMYDLFQ